MARRPREHNDARSELECLVDRASARTARRSGRSRLRALRALLVPVTTMCTVLLVGGAMVTAASGAPAPQDPLANSVRAVAGAPALGPARGLRLNANFVDITATPTGKGYWAAASDGGVFGYGDARFYGSTGSLPLVAPVVGIAATPTGRGYWLVGADGGVFGYGDAGFFGSMAARGYGDRIAPVVGIAATHTGRGYWLVAADGGVFGFGDARFYGSAISLPHHAPIIALAARPTDRGYYLLAADGGVFGFGDARFFGSAVDGHHLALGIAVPSNGRGYMIARVDGNVLGYGGAPSVPAPFDMAVERHPTVAIAARPGGGAWLAQGYVPPAPDPAAAPSSYAPSQDPFLRCTRAHESDTAGGYHARSADGLYHGAYQFLQSTWNNIARASGRSDLVGVDPANASPADQDFLALWLYHRAGSAPWGHRCSGLP